MLKFVCSLEIILIILLFMILELFSEVGSSAFNDSAAIDNLQLWRKSRSKRPDEDAILASVVNEINIHRGNALMPTLLQDVQRRKRGLFRSIVNPSIWDGHLVDLAQVYIDQLNLQANESQGGQCTLNNSQSMESDLESHNIGWYAYTTSDNNDLLPTHGGINLVRKFYVAARDLYEFPGEGLDYTYCNSSSDISKYDAFTTIMYEKTDKLGCAFIEKHRDPTNKRKTMEKDSCKMVLCMFKPRIQRGEQLMANDQFEAFNNNGEPLLSCNMTLEGRVSSAPLPSLHGPLLLIATLVPKFLQEM